MLKRHWLIRCFVCHSKLFRWLRNFRNILPYTSPKTRVIVYWKQNDPPLSTDGRQSDRQTELMCCKMLRFLVDRTNGLA